MDDARYLALLAQSRLTPQQQGMRRDDPTASAADSAAKGKPTKGKPSAPIDLSQWAESTTKASQLRHWPPLPLLLAAPKPIAAAGASKATFTVSTIADSGAGSLRQAIIDANARRPAIRSPAMSCSRRELPGMRPAGSPFGAPLGVRAVDTRSQPIPGVTITFAAPGSGASATLMPVSGVTDAAGAHSRRTSGIPVMLRPVRPAPRHTLAPPAPLPAPGRAPLHPA